MIGRRVPLRAKRKADPVTPAVHAAVLVRDMRLAGGCVPAFLDPNHGCRDRWGNPHAPDRLDILTLDHVQEGYGRMGKRASSRPENLVSACYFAHLGGWNTANRPLLREYLVRASRDPDHPTL
jgi:hypothetical protein